MVQLIFLYLIPISPRLYCTCTDVVGDFGYTLTTDHSKGGTGIFFAQSLVEHGHKKPVFHANRLQP